MANRWFNQFNWSLEKNPVVLFANIGQADTSTVTTVADVSKSLAGTFFRIKGFKTTASGQQYYFWFKVGGTGTDPTNVGEIGIEVDIDENATAVEVAEALYAADISPYSLFPLDFSSALDGDDVIFTSLGGPGCNNPHDGLSMYATEFTLAAAVLPVLDAAKSLGIKSVERTGTGLYRVTLGTPAPTSVVDLYNRLFYVGYSVVSPDAVPAAPLAFVVTETVSTDGRINLKLTAADGSTATDPACGETLLLEIYVKNSTGQ